MLVAATVLTAAPAAADCVTDSIGDNGPGALTRMFACRKTEQRLDALEQRQKQTDFDAALRAEQAREKPCLAAMESENAAGRNFSWIDCVQWR